MIFILGIIVTILGILLVFSIVGMAILVWHAAHPSSESDRHWDMSFSEENDDEEII